jgi:serine/threonine protein kinase
MYGEAKSNKFEWKREPVEFKNLVQKGVLGRGSFGWVTLVEDSKTGKQYALKAVSKQRIVETQQKTHIFNEKNLLARMDSPFLIKLCNTFKDADSLYFLLEPSLGGELFRVLRAVKAFPPSQARFYAGCVVSGFHSLHSQNLIYRDLKPENLLIGQDGYLKITDFGFCKEVPHKTHTMCGTPEYLAPEIVTAHGHGKPVDWWCVGILIYEMLVSHTPFYRSGEDQMEMYRRIVSGHVRYPSHLTPDAKNLISRLLELQPSRRLGSSQAGAADIKAHPWFSSFDWQALEKKQLKAPFVPSAKEVKKLSNFACNSEPIRTKKYVDDGSGWDKDF